MMKKKISPEDARVLRLLGNSPIHLPYVVVADSPDGRVAAVRSRTLEEAHMGASITSLPDNHVFYHEVSPGNWEPAK